jgi:shikimate kinase
MNIVLIGYRGTGKSTVGRLVAQQLSWPFLDADDELERRAGRSIREIFAADGESAFRDLETEVLKTLCSGDEQVLALGGGVIVREENRQLLTPPRQFVVWLQADAATLLARVTADATTAERRPPLTGLAQRDEIEQLLAARSPLYASCAQLVLTTAGQSPAHLADAIVAARS